MASTFSLCSRILLQNFKQLTVQSVRYGPRRKKIKRKVMKTSATIPSGGPVPPEYETVAYIPVPDHLQPDVWGRRGLDRKAPMLWHENWQMQKDARKRALSVVHGPLRTRLNCLQYNGFLPLELKQLADQEICWLPKQSCRDGVTNRCMLTSRPRGNKHRWRLSRIVFRRFADHGQMSGIMRAKW